MSNLVKITVEIVKKDSYRPLISAEANVPLGVGRDLLCDVAKGLVVQTLNSAPGRGEEGR